MNLSPAEIGLIRYQRSLNERIREAIYLWLFMGDTSLLYFELTRPRLKAA